MRSRAADASLPHRNRRDAVAMYKLCAINLEECEVVHIEINQRVDGRSASPHGIQQKMCRDFLSTFSPYGALVAPQRDLKEIMIVAQADFVTGTEFRCWLHKECLKIKCSSRADSLSVEECLRYSIVVWLEPHHYYRCGKGLLKGPFLGTNDPRSLRICKYLFLYLRSFNGGCVGQVVFFQCSQFTVHPLERFI
ncbi:hypothetical protein ANCDUO_18117 [Ancylostoma duodenale]|uniref:DUF4708 domain-containing protein n=1 Tax=Ancylostoma duodenale TaxID=51022 RepID=A0A0C2FT63_9BILA|nr:hypothetical protein ANCDUO_18117 [Ancylostoma duodenale]